jgi:hypothetical protein
MEAAEEVGVAALWVGDDEMFVGRHKRDGMDQDAELASADGERVQVELTDGRIGTEEVMAAKGAAGDHEGVARHHEAGLRLGSVQRNKRARVPRSDVGDLRRPKWRIPSRALADANPGGVVWVV